MHSFSWVARYAAAALVGYLLGALALPALAPLPSASSSTPLSRVGFVLREQPLAPSASWSALSADLQSVRSLLGSPEREAFDLVVAVRGLRNAGHTDWALAEQICRGLAWPRCEREPLSQLKALGRP